MLLYGMDWCYVLSCAMLIAWSIVVFFYISAIVYGKIHLHRPIKQDLEKSVLPGVSIAKPVCSSSDPNLVQNLQSFFELDYPTDDSDKELISIVQTLLAKYPNVEARVFIGAQDAVVNPKINNMMNAYDNAKYPLFMISDAGIKMLPETLKDMISHMTEKVGLVHQAPIMCDGELNFARQVEQLWFGGAHARVYVAANAYGVNCMTSMSCIFRKKILDEEGGLKKLGCYLGEDFYLGQLIVNKGWRIALCSRPALQNPGVSTVTTFQNRMKRWMYLRFTEMPHLLFLEPLQEHIILAPLSSLAFNYLFSTPIYIYLPLHYVCAIMADYLLLAILQKKRPAFSIWAYVRGWVFRELSPLYMVPTVMRMKTVVWSGKTFYIHYGGVTERVHDSKLVS